MSRLRSLLEIKSKSSIYKRTNVLSNNPPPDGHPNGVLSDTIQTDDPQDLDGYDEWLAGGECPWEETAPGVYFNERTGQTFLWVPGAMGSLIAGGS